MESNDGSDQTEEVVTSKKVADKKNVKKRGERRAERSQKAVASCLSSQKNNN